MANIILIETSTSLCTVALEKDGVVVLNKESTEPRMHASLTAQFLKEIMDESGMEVKDCDAVCVSAGPGSYTGLRVGTSTAKGLCFAAGLPLLSVSTMELLARQAIDEGLLPEGCRYIVPMIDARRMEVYASVFDTEGNEVKECSAVIVDKDSFADELSRGKVLFIGDGAMKCVEVLDNPNARFIQTNPSAAYMAKSAERLFQERKFEDTAYFEPFYLKQFVATESRRKLF